MPLFIFRGLTTEKGDDDDDVRKCVHKPTNEMSFQSHSLGDRRPVNLNWQQDDEIKCLIFKADHSTIVVFF